LERAVEARADQPDTGVAVAAGVVEGVVRLDAIDDDGLGPLLS
jgi:hypothetical protein